MFVGRNLFITKYRLAQVIGQVLKGVATEITNEQELDPQSALPYNPLQKKAALIIRDKATSLPRIAHNAQSQIGQN